MTQKCAGVKQNTERRVVAAFVAVALVLVVLFSAYYIIKEQHHECHGQAECPICHNISRCEQFLNQISTGLIHLAISFALVMVVVAVVYVGRDSIMQHTLVSFKVRLDN
ncbi:MAG: hypothetical protein J5802_08735 [Butyrivibrio sp.]|nr:hypothetical protein [Butyrivibrio sp.]